MTSEIITLAEASRRSGLSRRTLGRMLDDGRLAGERVGSSWNVDAAAVAQVSKPSTPPPPAITVEELEELRAEVEHLEARAEAAEVFAAERLAIVEQLTTEVADWRRRAEVAEALADERSRRLAEHAARRDDEVASLAAAHRQLSDALAITMAVTGALNDGRRQTMNTDLVVVPRRRWWSRSR